MGTSCYSGRPLHLSIHLEDDEYFHLSLSHCALVEYCLGVLDGVAFSDACLCIRLCSVRTSVLISESTLACRCSGVDSPMTEDHTEMRSDVGVRLREGDDVADAETS